MFDRTEVREEEKTNKIREKQSVENFVENVEKLGGLKMG